MAIRLACLPFLLQWFHPDERQMLEFAHFHAHGRLHPFMESVLHLRNQTLPWLFSWPVRLADFLGLAHPWAYLIAIHALIGAANWGAMTVLIERLRARFPGRDRAVDRFGWCMALFWGFPFLYSRGLLEAASLPFALLGLAALEAAKPARAGALFGFAAITRYPGALWAAGAALLASVDRRPPRFWLRAAAGFTAAIALGGLADLAAYGSFLASAPAYWGFNRPGGPVQAMFGDDSLAVYWRWFEFLLTPWLAPVFLIAATWSLIRTPRLLLFCLPYLAGHLLTPHREPRFMLPLTPILCLAIAEAALAGQWSRLGRAVSSRLPAGLARAGAAAVGTLLVAHVLLNFAWYPLQAWAQLESAQGTLIRSYSRMSSEPTRLAALGDPPVDALIPPSARWLGPECRWHRPPAPGAGEARLWVIREEAPVSACRRMGGGELPELRSPLLRRVLRARVAELWECPDSALAALCPTGVAESLPGEPQTNLGGASK